MKHISKPVAIASAIALMFALGACSKTDDKTAGQKLDTAIAKTEEKAAEIKADVKDAAADAKASSAQTASTIGEKIDDAAITASVNASFAKDPDLSAIKINVDTKDGAVTLMGPAPSSTAKDRATELAKAVKGVTNVNNQLTVKAG
ncbi:MAG: BON domain-containing protein [Pseudomonadota bacterium]